MGNIPYYFMIKFSGEKTDIQKTLFFVYSESSSTSLAYRFQQTYKENLSLDDLYFFRILLTLIMIEVFLERFFYSFFCK